MDAEIYQEIGNAKTFRNHIVDSQVPNYLRYKVIMKYTASVPILHLDMNQIGVEVV